MNLNDYKNKQDFKATDESCETKSMAEDTTQGNIYVIQEHDSSKLHYDLRLQFGDVLRSWAVPKEPSTEVGVKRLAIPTEDHHLSYAGFEGVIPEGHYGAGTVKIWDKGTFELLEGDDKQGKVIFRIEGKRLSGVYCLIKTRGLGSKEQWLFFMKKE
ncbi:MAG: 3'-phosphoesterase [Methanosarcinales archaeon]|nr:3'-phosphoesterase [Methanosarcinales archaeon]